MADERHPSSGGSATISAHLLQRGRSQIEDLVGLLTSIAFGMWRYRWIAVALAWGICVVGWTFVYSMPDVYRASTRFYIDAESMIKRVVRDLAISSDVMTDVNIVTRVMLSHPQLEKTARLADLELQVRTPEDHERLIADLARRVTLAKEGGESIYRINFEDSNRQTAETVVQTLLDNFMEDAHGERRNDSGAATEFVDQQLAEYERRLNEAEERLATFKRENIGLMPGETGDYYTRLQHSMETLAQTRGELQLATDRRNEYQQQIEGEEPVFGIVTPSSSSGAPMLGSTDALIAQYEEQLSTLLLKYTENHPDAVALRETIARLKAQQQQVPQTTERGGAAPGGGALEANPVYQRMRMGLSETEVEIATLRSKVNAQEVAVRDQQKLVDTIPEIERQLKALNRDYEVTRDQYETLLKKRESLHITGEVEQHSDQLQFRVIDPPRASLAPVGPNRQLFLVATTVFAIAAGLAVAFLLQQLNPVFVTRREQRELTGLPVLGTVSLAKNLHDRAVEKKRTLIFAATAAALGVALALAVLLQSPAHRLVTAILAGMPS